MGDKAFAVSTVLLLSWVTIWMISYDNIWLQIPIIAKLFPLPFPNGNLSYSDFVTSIGIIGTLFLGLMVAYMATQLAKESSSGRGFHRS